MKHLALFACLLLAGCESTRQFAHDHPVATGVGLAVLAGSIAASANHGSNQQQPAQGGAIGPGPSCTPQPNGSCR
jgi:hypothetical protein